MRISPSGDVRVSLSSATSEFCKTGILSTFHFFASNFSPPYENLGSDMFLLSKTDELSTAHTAENDSIKISADNVNFIFPPLGYRIMRFF